MAVDVNLFMNILVNKNEMLEQMKVTQKAAFEAGRTFASMGTSVNDAFKEGQVSLNRFDARLLSVLFSGMALQRAFAGVNRAIFNTFQKAEDGTSGLFVSTNRLGAAFEFMKFSIADAFDTEIFIGLVDGITGFVRIIADAPTWVKVAIVSITGSLALLGTGALIYAQIALAWGAIFGTGGLLAVKSLETAGSVKLIDTALKTTQTTASGITFTGLIGALGLVAASALVVKNLFEDIDEITSAYTEKNAPKLADSYLAGADNVEVLSNGIEDLNVEWSNLRAGLDRTIPLQSTFNVKTGEFTQHIITQQDELQGMNAVLQEYIKELNSIPSEVTTVIRTVREGGGNFSNISSVSD